MSSIRIRRHVNAARADVYRAFLDAGAVTTWMVPTGMTSHVHAFEPWEGGSFRISLTYDTPAAAGKTSDHTDTYHGRFIKVVTNEQIVEVVEFETADPALRGEMTITISLADADGGTDILAVHDGLPRGFVRCRQRGRLAVVTREARGARRVARSQAQDAYRTLKNDLERGDPKVAPSYTTAQAGPKGHAE